MDKNLIPQATSPLATWLSYLENLHSKTIDLGLERVSRVAGQLDVLQPAPFVFTVAGTNGKGTTCRTLETILMAAGYKVGVYSSPHLVRYTERVRVQGAELAESAHTASFAVLVSVFLLVLASAVRRPAGSVQDRRCRSLPDGWSPATVLPRRLPSPLLPPLQAAEQAAPALPSAAYQVHHGRPVSAPAESPRTHPDNAFFARQAALAAQ